MDLATDPRGYIRRRIELIKKDRTARIAELLAQIDRLQARINAQKEELKEELLAEFLHLEAQIEKLSEPQRSEALAALQECKLKSLELLGILAETTEAAMIAALEKGENIEETIAEIAKDLTYESLGYQVDAPHIKDVATTILDVASTLATATPNYSDEILAGAVQGVKMGIKRAIEKFRDTLEFTPPEVREILLMGEQIIGDLERIEEPFLEAVEDVAKRSDPGIREKLLEAAKSQSQGLKEEAQQAVALLKSRIATILENPELRAKALEARELGLRAFSAAKAKLDQAIKEAKDAIGSK